MIRRTILFDNQCGFALGENSRAPNPYVTWRFNEQDGQRNYFWGHYMNEPDMAERDLLNRAEDYQRRYHVQEVEQAPDKETYLYYSTQRPIDIGTYPNSYFTGDPLPAGRADSRLHRHVCAGVPGFPLWAPGPGRLAGGASAWCEVCGDGLYGELILTDKVSRGAGRRVT